MFFGGKVAVIEQFDLIHKTDWDVLIILDALRFDYFKKCNKLSGRLIKCHSKAPHTYRWIQETFPDKYDINYFSAHPYIGSKRSKVRSYNAPDHFKRILSIWALAWDDQMGTVHPDNVGEAVKVYIEQQEREIDGRIIIHYIQPHGPYIGKTKWLNPWSLEQHATHGVMADWVVSQTKPDPRFLRLAYKHNLELVLKSVEKYLPYFPGKVVISADHGEMLGEKGLYLHKENYPPWTDEVLMVVPWFILDR